ncbi:HNH endonuclease [Lacticaseibacillus mingshuiensis]|uniref:HNH endonuclease n=1 Tax=Lacticaseibacillus mingshuiensis TaxID=2799574 RepID=A0ABW4CF05_9LACO|nr:HNH endonuclease [Lacticaseibacillus mingshuiensis]
MTNYTEALMTAPQKSTTTTYLFKLALSRAAWRTCRAPYGNYMASYSGVIRRGSTGKVLTTHVNGGGYMTVTAMRDNGTYTTTTVNHLVGLAWLINPMELSDIDHKDAIKANNRVSNLQWLSHADNLRKRSIKSGKYPVISIKLSTGEHTKYPSVSAAAKATKLSYPTVRGICHHEYSLPSAGGYRFIFA